MNDEKNPLENRSAHSEEIAQRRRAIYALMLFVVLGIVLESALGFRARWLVDADRETTRTFLRLAHAHGTLLAIVRLVTVPGSRWIEAAMILVPLGFFLGAIGAHGSDPSLGVVLVPLGAVLLVVGLFKSAYRLA